MPNQLDKDYQALLKKVLEKGSNKGDRTGTGTLSIFGETIRHDMSKGFPVLTTKKVAFKTMVTELKWFLKGDTNIKYLVNNNCHIWDGDAFKAYKKKGGKLEDQKEFIEKLAGCDKFSGRWGELGPVYGKQWRKWKIVDGSFTRYSDQISNLIEGIKNDPNGRRHLVSAWNVSELEDMTLPPCHYSFQCYVADGKLSLMWNQRSADLFLGVPFNISSYALLLLLLCEETNYKPGELIGNLGDVHLYKNHLNQAAEQITRDSFELPDITIDNVDILNGEFDVQLLNYKSHPAIKAPLSN